MHFVKHVKNMLGPNKMVFSPRSHLNYFSTINNEKGRKKELESSAFRDPIRQIFISQSSDIFTNLALEDWIYRNHDFDHKHLLLLWRNNPCVVIGRHQNPWTESNVPFLRKNSVNLARRNSGGGTVYHDLGNINCTFFTRKSDYHRRHNLEIICNAIRRITELDVSVNKREDIVLNDEHKISGTAAKIGKNTAYHHCTVLVDVNECKLHDALNSQAVGIESRATQSVRVPVKNLKQVDSSMNTDELQEAIGWEFLRTSIDGIDGGMEVATNQRGFQLIRPDNEWFPGLDKLREDLQGHSWIFGKTPRFKVNRKFPLPDNIFPKMEEEEKKNDSKTNNEKDIGIELDVHLGTIQKVKVILPLDRFGRDLDLTESMHGLTFGPNLPQDVCDILSERNELSSEKRTFLFKCLKEMVGKFT